MFNNIMIWYINVHNLVPNFLNKGIIIATFIVLMWLSNGWCIPLIAASLLLNKLIKLAGAPKELNLGALSILPMMALF